MRIIDADGHIVEPKEVFTEYLDPKYHDWAPRVVQYGDHFRYACGDRLGFPIHARPETVGAPGQTTAAPMTEEPVVAQGADDPAGRLIDLDIENIDIAVLYPTYGLMIQGVTEREPAAALCRAINDWLATYCAHDPSRLIGIGVLPMAHPDDALAEAERCVSELGFKGVWRRPERIPGTAALHDPGYEPLWSFLEESNTPISVHPGLNGATPSDFYMNHFDNDYTAMHAAHFPVEQMMNVTDFVSFGILERHPELRVAFLECGAGWVPYYMHRLDEHLEVFGYPNAKLSMKPSEYFQRQCFVSVEEVEPAMGVVMDAYPDSVVFASDYPHGDGLFPGATKELMETDQISDADRNRIFDDNAVRLYALET